MTTDHRAEAERLLADSHEWARQAGELSPKASERACLAYAAVHALLAIHDTLTAADRYVANEAKQREAEPDPLDENDHRDRLDRDGDTWVRNPGGCWRTRIHKICGDPNCKWTLAYLNERYGPLTFAPNTAQDATGGDLSAPEGESGAEERGEAEEAVEPLLCPECGDHINTHSMEGCLSILCNCPCDCPLTPSDVARALIADAVKAERLKLAEELRVLLSTWRDDGVPLAFELLATRWEQQLE